MSMFSFVGVLVFFFKGGGLIVFGGVLLWVVFFYGVFVFVIFTAIFLCKDCSLKWQFSVT